MATYPWLTSDDLIAAVKRKIALPISQNTFSTDDILAFANEEMMISQVPSILLYHEEYLVYTVNVPLNPNQLIYPIPTRAIGMRLRDLTYLDPQNNMLEMTRVNSDDKTYFQRNIQPVNDVYAYYLQGNDVVLAVTQLPNPSGSLQFSYFLRPNQLVSNDQASVIVNFNKSITFNKLNIVAGDTITITVQGTPYVYTAVDSSPTGNQFLIDVDSITTGSNFVDTLNASGIFPTITATTTTPASGTVNIVYTDRTVTFASSNTSGAAVQSTLGVNFDQIPDNITAGSKIDVLQTLPGHRTYSMDVLVPLNSISGTIINFPDNTTIFPNNIVIGDYIASSNTCIIPQIPPDLHIGLAERTCARILASLGDQAGLQMVNEKITEIEKRQGNLLDQRVDGDPQKILNRHSLIRYGKYRTIGRY